jgi:hypothetical protein
MNGKPFRWFLYSMRVRGKTFHGVGNSLMPQKAKAKVETPVPPRLSPFRCYLFLLVRDRAAAARH